MIRLFENALPFSQSAEQMARYVINIHEKRPGGTFPVNSTRSCGLEVLRAGHSSHKRVSTGKTSRAEWKKKDTGVYKTLYIVGDTNIGTCSIINRSMKTRGI